MPIGKVFLLGGFPRKVATVASLRILKVSERQVFL